MNIGINNYDSSFYDSIKYNVAYEPENLNYEYYQIDSNNGNYILIDNNANNKVFISSNDSFTSYDFNFDTNDSEISKILSLISESTIEWGELSLLDEYVIENKKTAELINNLKTIFNNNLDNDDIIIKIFRSLYHIPYEEVSNTARAMCLVAFSKNNYEVDEAIIGLLENWRNKDALDLLNRFKSVKSSWLKKYIKKVINELEEELNEEEKVF